MCYLYFYNVDNNVDKCISLSDDLEKFQKPEKFFFYILLINLFEKIKF